MGWFSDDSYNQYNDIPDGEHHEASVTHELLGGAVAYEAAKAYEDHVAENGQPDSHAKAKEILAGFAGAFIDREVETKGLDWIDRERVHQDAREQLYQQYDQENGIQGDY